MIKNLSTKQLIKLYKMRLERKAKIHKEWCMYKYGTEPFWFYSRKYRTLERQCAWVQIELDKRGKYSKAVLNLPYWSNENVKKFDD